MDILVTSTLIVALAELGDKTQLLAILLATRFRRPWPIIAGILAATLANHALAAYVGVQLAEFLNGATFRIVIAVSFFAMGIWALIPDKLDDPDPERQPRFGAFVTTTVAFFLVEMGDKTQVATAALGARFSDVALVAAGTTLGMMLANVPAVFLGQAILRVLPLSKVRAGAALLFIAMGAWALAEALGHRW